MINNVTFKHYKSFIEVAIVNDNGKVVVGNVVKVDFVKGNEVHIFFDTLDSLRKAKNNLEGRVIERNSRTVIPNGVIIPISTFKYEPIVHTVEKPVEKIVYKERIVYKEVEKGEPVEDTPKTNVENDIETTDSSIVDSSISDSSTEDTQAKKTSAKKTTKKKKTSKPDPKKDMLLD